MTDLTNRLRDSARDRAEQARLTPGAYPLPPRRHIEWLAADEIERLRAEVTRLEKVVASGVLGTLLEADENEALLDFIKYLRSLPVDGSANIA